MSRKGQEENRMGYKRSPLSLTLRGYTFAQDLAYLLSRSSEAKEVGKKQDKHRASPGFFGLREHDGAALKVGHQEEADTRQPDLLGKPSSYFQNGNNHEGSKHTRYGPPLPLPGYRGA